MTQNMRTVFGLRSALYTSPQGENKWGVLSFGDTFSGIMRKAPHTTPTHQHEVVRFHKARLLEFLRGQLDEQNTALWEKVSFPHQSSNFEIDKMAYHQVQRRGTTRRNHGRALGCRGIEMLVQIFSIQWQKWAW